jgi:hypothetical protein
MDSQVQQSFIRIIDHANKLYEAINCGITTGGELYGRRYSCFRFNNDESANSFIMAMHTVFKEDWGVLKVEGNQIFVANNKDQGEEI